MILKDTLVEQLNRYGEIVVRNNSGFDFLIERLDGHIRVRAPRAYEYKVVSLDTTLADVVRMANSWTPGAWQ